MDKFLNLFKVTKSIIGMIHVQALPGTPLHKNSMEKIVSIACKEAEIYLKHDINAILVENMHDIPYIQSSKFQPETVACLSRVCSELRKIIPSNIPCGIQVLSGGNKEALAIAKACSFDFIRAEGYVFAHIGDEGYVNACAGEILRYRKNIDAENVLIFTDIKKKHSSHSITSDVTLNETAKAADFFITDGLILTGTATGDPVNELELKELRKNTISPILIGSGTTIDNIENYFSADSFIIGSYFKKGGMWSNDLEESRVKDLMNKIGRAHV